MSVKLAPGAIRDLGFAWPGLPAIESHQQLEAGLVDLPRTPDTLTRSHVFYNREINAAFAFKSQTGTGCDDFTDRFDELAGMVRERKKAVATVERIIQAATG